MSMEELAKHYPDNYYGEVAQLKEIDQPDEILHAGKVLYDRIKRGKSTSRNGIVQLPSRADLTLPIESEPGKLLDVGAGWGSFVAGALGLGWQAEVVDISASVVEIGEKLEIPAYQGTLEDVGDQFSGDYNLISFNHVLEHVNDPVQTLETVRALLCPGGVVRVKIPLWRRNFVRVLGKYWSALDLPRHRWHYRPKDIRKLANKAGFSRVLFLTETSTGPLSDSIRLLLRAHRFTEGWQKIASIDNKFMRATLYPTGWMTAAIH